jgi:hypothetical protein
MHFLQFFVALIRQLDIHTFSTVRGIAPLLLQLFTNAFYTHSAFLMDF